MTGELDLAKPHRIRGFEGSLGEWLQHLEWQYRAIVGEAEIRLWGRPVRAGGRKTPDGRDARFWHVITDTTAAKTEQTRKLSVTRASYLPVV